MAQPPTFFGGAQHFRIDHQANYAIAGNQYQILSVQQDIHHRLNPILDASHTRNRSTSPPDSECFPGTREEVIEEVTTWGDAAVESTLWWETGDKGLYRISDSDDDMYSLDSYGGSEDMEWETSSTGSSSAVVLRTTPHVYWLHGFAGCGKSAVSLKVANVYSGSGRLLASYFFFRGAGDRSTMRRFAVTLASQLAAALPATIPFIEAAVKAEPGLLTNHVSLTTQLDRLVLSPFRRIFEQGVLAETLTNGPFLIVIDGLDECEDKRGVEEFIEHILKFFKEHPTIPLRVFIASRVEQHIRNHLETDGVVLGNLDGHSAESDIEKFLEASFATVAKKDRVVKAYVCTHGSWPRESDKRKLVKHISGSFVLASTLFKYIVQPPTTEDPTTPMERIPLTLGMNGLDGLYSQSLAHSQHLPHFTKIISTIALLQEPLPIVEISAILGIEVFEVVRVLLNLQAIIHVPGTDEEGQVMLCHTSLRDFLTTESRSGSFFVPPSFHLYLSYYCFSSIIERNHVQTDDYCWMNFDRHWRLFARSGDCDFLTEIEQFKARQPLLVNRVTYHAFLFSMFSYTIIDLRRYQLLLNNQPYLLTEWANQLVLAAECPGPHTQCWLEKGLHYIRPTRSIVRFTEHTHEILQHDLQHASTAIRANFLGILESQPSSTREEKMVVYDFGRLSGIDIFNVLRWSVARAHFKWEELRVAPRPPLDLCISQKPGLSFNVVFSFDKELEEDDSDQRYTNF